MNVGFYGHVRQYHNIQDEIDANINDPIFADRAARVFLELSGAASATASSVFGRQENS